MLAFFSMILDIVCHGGVFVLWSLRLLIVSWQGTHNVHFYPNIMTGNALLIWNKKAGLGLATKSK